MVRYNTLVLGLMAFGVLFQHIESLNILQMGDSYASGNGAGNYYDSTCYRSTSNWGNKAADSLGAEYDNQACSGSVVADLTLQSNAIFDCTDLILLASGGNDLSFENVVERCFIPTFRSHSNCMGAIDDARSKLSDYESELEDALKNMYDKMRSDGKVVLVAYPHITLDVNYDTDCCGFNAPNNDIIEGLITLGYEIDEVQNRAIVNANADTGTDFVSHFKTKDLFTGHEPHPNEWYENPDRWIYEWGIFFDPLETYHLNPEGHDELAKALVPYIQESVLPQITNICNGDSSANDDEDDDEVESVDSPNPSPSIQDDDGDNDGGNYGGDDDDDSCNGKTNLRARLVNLLNNN